MVSCQTSKCIKIEIAYPFHSIYYGYQEHWPRYAQKTLLAPYFYPIDSFYEMFQNRAPRVFRTIHLMLTATTRNLHPVRYSIPRTLTDLVIRIEYVIDQASTASGMKNGIVHSVGRGGSLNLNKIFLSPSNGPLVSNSFDLNVKGEIYLLFVLFDNCCSRGRCQ